MEKVLLVLHLIVAVFLIGTVLLQRSEGGALGIGGNGGGSNSLFSGRGVGNTLTRATAFLALAFFATSIALTMIATRKGGSVLDSVVPSTTQEAPKSGGTDGSSVLPKLGDETPKVPTNN